MNILHVIENLDPGKGGPSISCPSLAAAQASHGHKVSLLYYGDAAREQAELAVARETITGFDRLDRIVLRCHDNIELLFSSQVRRYLRDHLHHYDFVHIHGVWRPMLLAAAQQCVKQGVPYTVEPHGMLDYWSMNQQRLKKQLAFSLLWRRVIERAAFIHALNLDEKSAIERFGLSVPIVISANGIAREMLDEIAQIPLVKSQETSIVFMSRLHHKKGLDILLDAFALVRQTHSEVKLKVAGPDDGALKPALAQVQRLGLSDAVEFLGPIYGQEKYAFLRTADIFCLPSRQEGFSIMLAETLACAVPVVITTGCNFPEVAQHRAGQVVELDAAAVAAGLRIYLDNPALRLEHGANGQQLIAQHFTWDAIAIGMLQAYESHRQHSMVAPQAQVDL